VGFTIGKLKIYTMDGSKYCAQNVCNTMRIAPRRHKVLPSGANGPSDVVVSVNFNAEINLSLI
jgi:hypothetical protein